MKSSLEPESRKSAAGLLLVGLGGLGLQWHALRWAWEEWGSDGWFLTYSLGPAVIAVTALLLWRARPWQGQPSPWGSAAVGLALLAGAWAQMSGHFSLAVGSLLLLAFGLTWRAKGLGTGARLLPALLCLALVIPIQQEMYGGAVAAHGVALSAVALGKLLGAPVVQESGYQLFSESGGAFYIPVVTLAGGMVYTFDPGCGGIQKFRTMLVMGFLAMALMAPSWKGWLIVLPLAPLLAFLSKVVDATAVLTLTPSLGAQEALALYHGWLSLLTFAAALAGLLWACSRWGLPQTTGMPAKGSRPMRPVPDMAHPRVDSAPG